MGRIISFYELGERYQTLRIIAALFILIGAVLVAIGALLMVYGLYTLVAGSTGGPLPGAGPFAARQVGGFSFGVDLGVMLSLIWSIAFLLAGLEHIALGALVRLLIHLEENTRASVQALDKIRARLESNGAGVEPTFRS